MRTRKEVSVRDKKRTKTRTRQKQCFCRHDIHLNIRQLENSIEITSPRRKTSYRNFAIFIAFVCGFQITEDQLSGISVGAYEKEHHVSAEALAKMGTVIFMKRREDERARGSRVSSIALISRSCHFVGRPSRWRWWCRPTEDGAG